MLPVIVGVAANKFGGRLTQSALAPPQETALANTTLPPLSTRLV